MLVQGRVNKVPARFIVDTGANLVVIPPAVAARAGVRTRDAPMLTVRTAGGEIRAPKVLLDELAVGGVRRSGVAAVVQKVAADEDVGLLGMNFLSAYRMSVDHAAGVLVLEPRR